ncbi:SCO1664 family protein [Chloroflexota bacterium]
MSTVAQTTLELTPERVLHLLSHGEIDVEGLIPWSSNATLLVTVEDAELSTLGVYKPQRGERPLWDFPTGTLGQREVAAYVVCEALDWELIPPTVMRSGPYGLGSVQFFIHAREDAHYFTIQHELCHRADLMRLAAFDVVTNNADRKSGHCLLDENGGLWAIDNALTFHVEPKLRTVIWDYAEQPLPDDVLDDLERLMGSLTAGSSLSQALAGLLSEPERVALGDRLRHLIQKGRFPPPGPGRPVPWPPV